VITAVLATSKKLPIFSRFRWLDLSKGIAKFDYKSIWAWLLYLWEISILSVPSILGHSIENLGIIQIPSDKGISKILKPCVFWPPIGAPMFKRMSGQPSIRPTPHVLILHDIVGMEMIGK
jgi:hypothetical protein